MTGRRFSRAMMTSAAAWTLAFVAAVAAVPEGRQAPPGREDMAQFLPPGAGKALVARECSVCHDLGGVVRLRAAKPEWEAVVLDMVARGAPLMVEDVDTIVSYLSEVFGPQAPPLTDVNTAVEADLLKLPGMTPALAAKLVEQRKAKGGFASRDEVRSALGLDDPAFQKMSWYLRAQPGAAAARD